MIGSYSYRITNPLTIVCYYQNIFCDVNSFINRIVAQVFYDLGSSATIGTPLYHKRYRCRCDGSQSPPPHAMLWRGRSLMYDESSVRNCNNFQCLPTMGLLMISAVSSRPINLSMSIDFLPLTFRPLSRSLSCNTLLVKLFKYSSSSLLSSPTGSSSSSDSSLFSSSTMLPSSS